MVNLIHITPLIYSLFLSLSLHLPPSLSFTLSLVARNANFYYADQRVYNGHYVDAIVSYTRTCIPTMYCLGVADTMMSLLHHLQRNGKGTMTWPNKSCYVVCCTCTCTCIYYMYTLYICILHVYVHVAYNVHDYMLINIE